MQTVIQFDSFPLPTCILQYTVYGLIVEGNNKYNMYVANYITSYAAMKLYL